MARSSAHRPKWRTLDRVLAVFAVLCGLLLMHGLSGNHDLNATSASIWTGSGTASSSTAPHSAHGHPLISSGAHGGPGADSSRAHETSAHAGHLGMPAPTHGDESGHGAAEACLALLTASLAGLAAALALGGARAFAATIGASGASRNHPPSPPSFRRDHLRPSLDALCLSRT